MYFSPSRFINLNRAIRSTILYILVKRINIFYKILDTMTNNLTDYLTIYEK